MEQVVLSLKTYGALKSQADGKNAELEKKIEGLMSKIEVLEKNNENLMNGTPHIEEVILPGYLGMKPTITRRFMGIDEIKAVWEKERASEIKKLEKEILKKSMLIQDLETEAVKLQEDRDGWIEIAISKKSLFKRIFGS
ncbi:MAG: hypothetical protein ACRDD8_11900 [Bacteroidales bacterium]